MTAACTTLDHTVNQIRLALFSGCRRKRARSEEDGSWSTVSCLIRKVSGPICSALTPASWCALRYLLAKPVTGHHRAPRGECTLLFRGQGTWPGAWPVRGAANRRVGVGGRGRADEHRGGRCDRECCCCVDPTHIELFLHAAWICRTEIGRYLRLMGRWCGNGEISHVRRSSGGAHFADEQISLPRGRHICPCP
jgi:hypothetical protein